MPSGVDTLRRKARRRSSEAASGRGGEGIRLEEPDRCLLKMSQWGAPPREEEAGQTGGGSVNFGPKP